jgi:heat-inducible transcriptional repressor
MAAILDDRSREILKSLIQVHIATGEPVGSETLARALNHSLSSATLRNVMADLEKLGYLAQPHTSAGRLPTDEAYRIYVDSLSAHRPLAPREAAAIDSELRPREATPVRVMETASHLLSRLTGSVGFVLPPDLGRAAFRHVDLVRLPHPRILVVMVAQSGLVTSKVVEVEDPIDQEELQACANYLNAHFPGLSLAAIRAHLLDLMKEEKALYDSLLQKVVSVGQRAFAEADADAEEATNVYLGGASGILGQPEFEDVHRMRALFKAFEEKNRLVKILTACLSAGGVRVVIGHEIPDPALRDLALVAARYPLDEQTGGAVGVMGATRMEYARVMAVVDHIGRALSRALAEMRS